MILIVRVKYPYINRVLKDLADEGATARGDAWARHMGKNGLQLENSMTTVYDFEALQIDGKALTLDQFKGRVLLIVNTASACGFTPQFAGLEALHQQYGDKGLVVLGFPCNQFGAQDSGSNSEIAGFCQLNYGVTFTMMAKIDVNGAGAHPLYQWLSKEAPGLLGSKSIKWNFTKFLVGKDGAVLTRYAPTDTPQSLTKDIEKALAA